MDINKETYLNKKVDVYEKKIKIASGKIINVDELGFIIQSDRSTKFISHKIPITMNLHDVEIEE